MGRGVRGPGVVRGVAREAQATRGKQQEAGGGTGACRRATNTRLASFWREVEDDWQMGLVGCYSARAAR